MQKAISPARIGAVSPMCDIRISFLEDSRRCLREDAIITVLGLGADGYNPNRPPGGTRSQDRNLSNGDWTAEAFEERKWLAVSRAVVCQDGHNRMTNKTDHSLTPVAKQPATDEVAS
jgi:hypothetical protein